MRAMILAAGLGTRLRPLTYLLPKPMAPVLNVPVMEWIVRLLVAHGFTEVVTNLSYLPKQIREHFGDGGAFGIELAYSEEAEPLGTAGGVAKVRDFLTESDSFLIISGDALTDIDLSAMREAHESHDGIATLATRRVEDTTQFGVAITDEQGRIQGFQEKPDPAEALSELGNCGIYCFSPEIFDYFPDRASVDWANDVFPALLENDVPFHVHEIDDYWNDVGSLGELRQGTWDVLEGAMRLDVTGAEVAPGAIAGEGSSLDGVDAEGPVWVGAGVSFGSDVRLIGPVAIGDGATVGDGAALRDTIVFPGTDVAPGEILIGAIHGGKGIVDRLRPLDALLPAR